MKIVKTWGARLSRSGDVAARPTLVVRFRWRWTARLWCAFVSKYYAISTIHDEADQSNVEPLRRVG